MTPCGVVGSGTIEAYFYGELPAERRAQIDRHLATCADCEALLADLSAVRAVLKDRAVVSAPAGGDWSAFMARLTREIATHDAPDVIRYERREYPRGLPADAAARSRHWSPAGLVAAAALLLAVSTGVFLSMRSRAPSPAPLAAATELGGVPVVAAGESGFAALSEEHFVRSKLVVLGLAAKDSSRATPADWTYERDLAPRLLSDTRLYRRAAEDRGLRSLEGVMRDLELVLIQTSFTDTADPEALPRIQRLIATRNLVAKMDAVSGSGL